MEIVLTISNYFSDFFSNLDWAQIKVLLVYLSIPISSGIIGWATNWMALLMTFYPLEYIGIKPFGWQGIIPSKAQKMATKSVEMLTSKLLRIEERFEQLDPTIVARQLQPELETLSVKIINEAMEAQAGVIWKNTPIPIKKQIYQRAKDEIPNAVVDIMSEVNGQIDGLLDLKRIAIEALMEDKQLVNEIFLRCGDKEFKFIEVSGFWFGGLFGLAQMVLSYNFPSGSWYILPGCGLIVGYLTNVLALKLIFEPLEPINILGIYKFHGLFLKRQKEVAREYAKVITEKILPTEAMTEYLVRGPASDRLAAIINKEVSNLVDDVVEDMAGASRPIFTLVAGKRMDIAKNILMFHFMRELPIVVKQTEEYAEKALNLENTLAERMGNLSYREFEQFLRPVFQEDEWILILVGAVLGMFAGILQFVVMWYFGLA
ncbi:MAG: hypothetical protein COZ18_09195 [Flexibacter sp. CG_4_10_14_3_um_filter_32_15]|nr:MAG: hypothetical protein COZ18_09195 [Flexibacter sp. CG_4_10_14_3_um_filter_32_15]